MEAIEKHYNNVNYIKETAMQLEKDFSMIGQEIFLNEDKLNSFDQLFEQIYPVVRKLLLNEMQNLYNLLYRIDISEEMIRQRLKNNNDLKADELLTELIIKRELQKIITKNQLKNN